MFSSRVKYSLSSLWKCSRCSATDRVFKGCFQCQKLVENLGGWTRNTTALGECGVDTTYSMSEFVVILVLRCVLCAVLTRNYQFSELERRRRG